jgi:ferredoxin
MGNTITFNEETCKKCGLCSEVCPNNIIKKDDLNLINLLVHHVVPLMKNRLPELKMGVEDTITRNAPAMILFHANRNTENYKQDIYIALTYGFLAAHALGLGGSAMDIIPPPIEKNQELRKMFFIPDTNEVVGCIILGYPKYSYQKAIKRELKSVKWI